MAIIANKVKNQYMSYTTAYYYTLSIILKVVFYVNRKSGLFQTLCTLNKFSAFSERNYYMSFASGAFPERYCKAQQLFPNHMPVQ